MEYVIMELLMNIKYLSYSDLISFSRVSTTSRVAYNLSGIMKYIAAYNFKTYIDKLGFEDLYNWDIVTSKELVEIFNIIGDEYYNKRFDSIFRLHVKDHILMDRFYPKCWYKSRTKVKSFHILRFNRLIKNNKNVDAILNYANPPVNQRYYC